MFEFLRTAGSVALGVLVAEFGMGLFVAMQAKWKRRKALGRLDSIEQELYQRIFSHMPREVMNAPEDEEEVEEEADSAMDKLEGPALQAYL